MSIARAPLDMARRCLSLSSALRRGVNGLSSSSSSSSSVSKRDFSSESESPAESASDASTADLASESLIREAVAAVQAAKAEVDAAAAPTPFHGFEENYVLDGVEYTGRANINYDDAFIHYKLEVDMESLRLDQPHPKVPDVDRFKS